MTTAILVLILSLTSLLNFDENQRLRRHDPQMQDYEISESDSNKISVSFEKGVHSLDMRNIVKYISEQFDPEAGYLRIYIHKLPVADDMYYAVAGYEETKFFLLRKRGAEITALNKINNKELGCFGLVNSIFFSGNNRMLIVTSFNAPDGGFCGNYAFEYKDGNLKPIGEVPVYDGTHGAGAHQGHSPMERATAEYRNNTYYVTMRGEGSLYALTRDSGSYTATYRNGKLVSESPKDKKLAPPRSSVTFFFNGSMWQPLRSRQVKRR